MPEDKPPLFASAELMAARSQGDITKESHPFLEDELAAATRAVREFCRWHVAPAHRLVYRRVRSEREAVWLPASQIASIDAVTIDGRVLSADEVAAVEFDPETGWTNLTGRRFVIAFTAGYDEVPADLVSATLELAAVGLGTALGQVREQAGTVSISYGAAGGGIDEDDSVGRRLVAYRLGRLP